jgi:hypothetical protein
VISIPSETHTITKIAIFVGFAFVLIAAFNPSAGAAWTNFQNSIQNFPQFNNPFDNAIQVSSFTMKPTSLVHGIGSYTNPTKDVVNCDTSPNLWSCVRDNNGTDGNKTYLMLYNPTFGGDPPGSACGVNECTQMTFDLEGSSLKGSTLRDGSFDFWCQTIGGSIVHQLQVIAIDQWNTGMGAYQTIYTGSTNRVQCPMGYFAKATIRLAPSLIVADTSAQDERLTVDIEVAANEQANNYGIAVTTVRFNGVYSVAATGCSAGDFFGNLGCQVGQFFDFIGKLGQFVVNGAVFIGQILVYFGNAAIQFFGLFGYFFSIAGLPPILQGLLTVLFIGFSLYIAVAFFGKIRGTGNTG